MQLPKSEGFPAEGAEEETGAHEGPSGSSSPLKQSKEAVNPSSPFAQSARAIHDLRAALRHDFRAILQSSPLWMRKGIGTIEKRQQTSGTRTPNEKFRRLSAAFASLSSKAMRAGMTGIKKARPLKLRSWKGLVALLPLLGLLIVASVLTWALKDVPWQEIADGSMKPVIVLETADGEPLVRQGPYQGPYAGYEQFPPHLVDAVLSIEDRRFMDHHGIDLKGIARALIRNFQAGSVVQGGSTITQQLIKLQYLESDRTLKRKIQELVIAFWLEWKLGKQEILTRYLNSVYLGSGATGMPAAARIYFNKDIGALDIPESAMLAGLLKAPSQLNPIDNFEGARQRTATVLDAMAANGKLTPQEADAAKNEFAELHPTTPTPRSGSWFADWISPQASEIAGSSPGSTTVRTTLVPRLQEIAERVVRHALDEEGKARGASQAAMVAMTPDGAVVAMVGGHDYKTSQFNRAVTAMRQPGSTFKLFVYYAALKKGLSLSDQVLDGPIELNGWSPQNFGGGYRGWVTLAEAFARSLNAATAALAQEVGLDSVAAAAKELGINAALTTAPALSLGASEVSLLDLTGAYASVRLGKSPVEPWGIIEFQASGQPRGFRVGAQVPAAIDLSPYQPDLLALLQLVVERGTGRDADPGMFAAGKTGTSQDNRDAWFVGFTDALVAGVWVGNDDDAPMKGVTGGALPARIWREFMQAAMAEPAPQIDPDTGMMTSEENAAPSCNITA
ncbi:PBP1A family penicillin-binding protein, partial [Rhizobium sp. SEMIA 4085]|nr:PBP1A family penicillin-binding protein [Rhizobium sp. SEMIA 4085]